MATETTTNREDSINEVWDAVATFLVVAHAFERDGRKGLSSSEEKFLTAMRRSYEIFLERRAKEAKTYYLFQVPKEVAAIVRKSKKKELSEQDAKKQIRQLLVPYLEDRPIPDFDLIIKKGKETPLEAGLRIGGDFLGKKLSKSSYNQINKLAGAKNPFWYKCHLKFLMEYQLDACLDAALDALYAQMTVFEGKF